MEHGVTPGEAGGVIAGALAVLASLGAGLRWLFTWTDKRALARDERLRRWEENLIAREKSYREEIEGQLAHTRTELGRVERELEALRAVLAVMASELHRHDPASPALTRALALLND